MANNLARIALDMERQAYWQGQSLRELSRGLRLEMTWRDGQKTLTLSRPAVLPSEQEVSICRSFFSVPENAQRQDGDNEVVLKWPV